jgi:hypothetical protein
MARVIPVFRLVLDHDVSYSDVEQNPYVRDVVMSELVDAVKDGIKRRRRNISLFVINDSNYIVGLDKKQWKPSLESALKYYEIREEYTTCSEIVKLINSL